MVISETKNCFQFIGSVNQYFGYLFDEHNFEVMHTAEECLGELCLIILESPSCRMRFTQDKGSFEAAVGDIDAIRIDLEELW